MVQHISNLIKVAGQTVERATLTGLQNASQKSGVSFQYLVAKAAQESSLQTDAKA
jgi:L-aminopeptidase/D-esterase-like protein